MITMTDVARHAGVTTATVSHVLTGKVAVREPTLRRVQAAIDQLGYRPNLLARALSQGTTRLLVLLISRRALPVSSTIWSWRGITRLAIWARWPAMMSAPVP